MKEINPRFAKKALVAMGSVVATVGSVAANAAYTLPAAVEAAFVDMSSAWTAIEGKIWPVVAVVVIGFFVIRMFKRGAKQVG